ncbi:hypothetical protein ACQPZ8_12755 [Actinomadura nitritigenes]|uniref:hypothetical protein n=1 Tax=Actinomadura nitritigenes TaxID=134602 RepID=UPI003D8F0EEA
MSGAAPGAQVAVAGADTAVKAGAFLLLGSAFPLTVAAPAPMPRTRHEVRARVGVAAP